MAETRGTRRATHSGGTKSTGGSRPKTASGTSRPKSTSTNTFKSTAKSAAKSKATSPPKGTAKSTATSPRAKKSASPRATGAAGSKAADRSRAPHHGSGETSGEVPAAVSRLREIATEAADELAALIGHEAEGVSAVRRGEAGWRVEVDVVEVHRIPDTTSLLATYEMSLDEEGQLVEYRRLRRFRRGWADG
ncbi:gas vesicle protein GvpO [Streptomyces sp. NRRL F-5630]|uniref:gas vesicle protein GvpO n=1 Tax=unclassified Streptomyces TaxID=2593676 RepID=UPI000D142746